MRHPLLFAFAFTLAVALIVLAAVKTGLADTMPAPRPDVVVLERTAPEALDKLITTVLGGVTTALVFVGGIALALRPLIVAKVAEAIQSVQFDKRQVFEQAVAAGLELHPNDYVRAATYVESTIPDTIRDLGIRPSMLPTIAEARKLSLDRERLDKAKR